MAISVDSSYYYDVYGGEEYDDIDRCLKRGADIIDSMIIVEPVTEMQITAYKKRSAPKRNTLQTAEARPTSTKAIVRLRSPWESFRILQGVRAALRRGSRARLPTLR